MASDVKALPVVAYRWRPSAYWGDYVHSGNPDQADEAEKFGVAVDRLVLQSDAESALAELRVEVEVWKKQADLYLHMIIACGVAATHPDANLTKTCTYADKWDSQQLRHVQALRQRADTAEARLERAERAIASALREIEWWVGEHDCCRGHESEVTAELRAFLGEGNGTF